MAELYRFAAFISYSSRDAAFARRLHGVLEGYGIPNTLGRFDLLGGGGKRNRIYPVFRDREELPAGDLGENVEAALRASGALIVVCSPAAAASPWVAKEIEYFTGLGRRERIFCIITDTVPLRDADGRDTTIECFPAPLVKEAPNDSKEAEPLAGDARKGRDGFRNAWLKVVAGLIGVTPGQLIDRDKRRRTWRRSSIAIGSFVSTLVVFVAISWVDTQTWRSRLESHAENLAGKGHSLDALTFALASEPARGTLFSARSDAADGLLRKLGATRVRWDLGTYNSPYAMTYKKGAVQAFEYTADGGTLLIVRDGRATAYDLRDGAMPVALGPLQLAIGWHLLSAKARFLVTVSSTGIRGTLFDLSHHASRDLGDLGDYTDFQSLADDGKYMLAARSGAQHVIVDVSAQLGERGRSSGQSVVLDLSSNPVRVVADLGILKLLHSSPDGRTVFVIGRDGQARFVELGATISQVALGAVSPHPSIPLQFSADGRTAVVMEATGRLICFSLSTPSPRNDLGDAVHGSIDNFRLSANGRRVIAIDENGHVTLHDLAHLGQQSKVANVESSVQSGDSFVISGDGRYLLVGDYHDQTKLIDLDRRMPPRDLGVQDWRLGIDNLLSADGRVLVGLTVLEGHAVRLDLSHGGVFDDLGDLGSAVGKHLASNGEFLDISDLESNLTLYDIKHSPLKDIRSLGGEALWSAVCNASGDAVRAFSPRLRAPSAPRWRVMSPQERAISESQRGRPWNPCDWRGVGAGAEGLAQWWRLIRVRYLGAPDYVCGEADAAGHMPSIRLNACQYAALRDSEAR